MKLAKFTKVDYVFSGCHWVFVAAAGYLDLCLRISSKKTNFALTLQWIDQNIELRWPHRCVVCRVHKTVLRIHHMMEWWLNEIVQKWRQRVEKFVRERREYHIRIKSGNGSSYWINRSNPWPHTHFSSSGREAISIGYSSLIDVGVTWGVGYVDPVAILIEFQTFLKFTRILIDAAPVSICFVYSKPFLSNFLSCSYLSK